MSDTDAHTIAYVRGTMLPAQPAPVAEAGAVKWLRENLFSGPLNTVLTVLGVMTVYFLFTHFYPWFRHGVWNANSIAECRSIIAAEFGEGATGAGASTGAVDCGAWPSSEAAGTGAGPRRRLASATSCACQRSCNSTTSPTRHRTTSQIHATFGEIRPLATGRLAVRATCRSRSASTMSL